MAADDAPLLLDATRLIWRRSAGRQPTGVDRVCLAYMDHFGARSQAVIQHRRFRRILDRKSSQALFRLLHEPPALFRAALAAGALRHAGRMNGAGKGRLYLNIGHTGLDSEGFRSWLARADVRPVYFVHDLIPITHPQWCRAGEDVRHRSRMRTVLDSASGVIGNSRATLDELSRFAADEGMREPPGVAAWLGCSLLPATRVPPAPARPTFVVLGTIEARKNHMLLLDVWSRLIARLGHSAPRLLIAGQRGWEADDVFRRLDHDALLRGHVVELNRCPDEALAGHLASARALLFPSMAEGFGLPLVEALASRVPVIASDLPAFREVGQDVPLFLDPKDVDSWEAAIAEFAEPESPRRADQLRRLEHFRPPTWTDHFRRVERWLPSLDEAPAAR